MIFTATLSKPRIIAKIQVILLPLILAGFYGYSQGLSATELSTSDVCANSHLMIFFNDGTVTVDESYTVEMSVVNSSIFPSFPFPIKVMGTGTTSPMQIKLPPGAKAGTYKIRIVSSSGEISNSLTLTVCGSPTKPLSDRRGQPQIHGDRIVWASTLEHADSSDNETDFDLYFYNGDTTRQLTYHPMHDVSPWISENVIAWTRDSEIMYYDGTTIRQITNSSDSEFILDLEGSTVYYEKLVAGTSEFFKFDGVSETRITNNSVDDVGLDVHGDRYVFMRKDGTDYDIFYFDGTNTRQLTNNNYNDESPKISDNIITWLGYESPNREVFVYDGVTTKAITSNSSNIYALTVSEDNIAWRKSNYIYLSEKGQTPVSIAYSMSVPQISGNKIVYTDYTDDTHNLEVFLYNGSTTIQLSMLSGTDHYPAISGNNVVWSRDTEGYVNLKQLENDCFSGTPVITNPAVGTSTLCVNSSNSQYTTTEVPDAYMYEWTLLPSEAGVVTGQGTTADVNWSDSFTGTATLSVTAKNYCGFDLAVSANLEISILQGPEVPAPPIGPSTVCTLETSSLFNVDSANEMLTYSWKVTPEEAGEIAQLSNGEISVTWNNLFAGVAGVAVKSQSSCGESAYSPNLEVTILSSNDSSGMPHMDSIQATKLQAAPGENIGLQLLGNLNNAEKWVWYANTCGVLKIGEGDSIFVAPSETTTFFARGEGGCTSVLQCLSVTIEVIACIPAELISVSASSTNVNVGDSTKLSVTGSLNGAAEWTWYKESCGSEPIGRGENISVTITETSKFYVTAIENCELEPSCKEVTINAITEQPDTIAPTLAVTAPANNATEVDPTSTLKLTFSESVKFEGGAVKVYNAATNILISDTQLTLTNTSISAADVTIDIGLLPELQKIYVTITGGAFRDEAGNLFVGVEPHIWTFTTKKYTDLEAPLVVNTYPANKGADVSVDTKLKITFNEDVKLSVGSLKLQYQINGFAMSTTVQLTEENTFIDDSLVTIVNSKNLPPFTEIKISISEDAFRDINENIFEGQKASYWTFITGSATQTESPIIVEMLPAAGSQADPESPLKLTFSENVHLQNGEITIHDYNTGAVIASSVATSLGASIQNGNQLVILPGDHLPSGKKVYITLSKGIIADNEGNEFAGISDTYWNFTSAGIITNIETPHTIELSVHAMNDGFMISTNGNGTVVDVFDSLGRSIVSSRSTEGVVVDKYHAALFFVKICKGEQFETIKLSVR